MFLMEETSRFKRALRIAAHNYLVDAKRSAYERAVQQRQAAAAASKRKG